MGCVECVEAEPQFIIIMSGCLFITYYIHWNLCNVSGTTTPPTKPSQTFFKLNKFCLLALNHSEIEII